VWGLHELYGGQGSHLNAILFCEKFVPIKAKMPFVFLVSFLDIHPLNAQDSPLLMKEKKKNK